MSTENIKNGIYAPGTATYGIMGEQGHRGLNGHSIYYVPDNINNSTKENIIENYIKTNKFISNNYTISDEIVNDRPYQYGDLFLTSGGEIFKYDCSTNERGDDLICIGKFINDTGYFSNANNEIIYSTNGEKIAIGYKKDGSTNELSSLLNIYKKDGHDYLTLYNNEKNKKLTITDATDNLLIKSDGVCIDNLYINAKKGDTSINCNDMLYYKPLLVNNFDISVRYEDTSLRISIPENYIYSIFYKNNDNNTLLEEIGDTSISLPCDNSSISVNNIKMITIASKDSYISKIVYTNDANINQIDILVENQQIDTDE